MFFDADFADERRFCYLESNLHKLKYIINQFPIATLLLLFCLAELIINPIGNFPLNDDWWYAHLYKQLFEGQTHGAVSWASTSLWGQLILTKLYSFVFGYSYTALRFFTIILSAASIVLFYNLCIRYFKLKWSVAFLLSLLLIFNPLFLCLSNSYMTDVPFLFFILGAVYFYFSFTENKKPLHFFLSLVFFVLAILTRQITLAFLIGILVSELISSKKIQLPSLLLFLVPLAVLFVFELSLQKKVNNNIYTYVFFHSLPIQNKIPLADALINFSKRWLHYVSISGFVLFPILIPYLWKYLKTTQQILFNKKMLLSFLLFIPVVISLFKFPIGNYIYNCGLGPDTLYDVYMLRINMGAIQSSALFFILKAIAALGSFAFILASVHFLFSFAAQFKNSSAPQKQGTVFILISLLFYYGFLSLSSAIFDRYILVFTLFFVILLHQEFAFVLKQKLFLGALLFLLALFSVLGTKDYLNTNSERWNCISLIKEKYHATDKQINAGYEHEGSCFADSAFWYEKWLNLPPNEYVISRGPVKNYTLLGYSVYQRYLPFKKDTLFYLKYQGNTPK